MIIKRKQRDTRHSAGELFQFEQLTSIVPTDIEESEKIRAFVRSLPKNVEEKLKQCGADHYNTDLFDDRIHRAFAAEAERKATQYDSNLYTIEMIYRIQCGMIAHLDETKKLFASDISAAETELTRLNELHRSL